MLEHDVMVMRQVKHVVSYGALMLVTVVALTGCQPRAAVSPASPAPQAEEQPAPAQDQPPTPTTEKPPRTIPWPPPPPPPPPPSEVTADSAERLESAFPSTTPKRSGATPATDAAASVKDVAPSPETKPPTPPPADEIPSQSSGTSGASQPASPVLTPAENDAAQLASTTATQKPAPSAETSAADIAVQVEATAAIGAKRRWKNVRGGAAVPDQDALYDHEGPAYQTLQKANQALEGFPLIKKHGELDWSEALDSGLIQPRASLAGSGEMLVLDFDVVMRDTKSTPYVRFSHKSHTQWLDCSNCHRQIFIPMIDANPISMAAISEGKYCGVCHNNVAFPTADCGRCHNIPKDQ